MHCNKFYKVVCSIVTLVTVTQNRKPRIISYSTWHSACFDFLVKYFCYVFFYIFVSFSCNYFDVTYQSLVSINSYHHSFSFWGLSVLLRFSHYSETVCVLHISKLSFPKHSYPTSSAVCVLVLFHALGVLFISHISVLEFHHCRH